MINVCGTENGIFYVITKEEIITTTKLTGDFRCECADGYEVTADGHACVDTDECLSGEQCPLPGECLNTR